MVRTPAHIAPLLPSSINLALRLWHEPHAFQPGNRKNAGRKKDPGQAHPKLPLQCAPQSLQWYNTRL